MQIAEVSIEPKAVKKKKYSAKTKKAAEEFLSEMDLSIDQLDDNQKVHILKHFRNKRTIKWYVPIMIIMFFVNIALIFGYVPIYNSITDIYIEPETKVEVVDAEGGTSYMEITPRELEMQKNHGFICAMIGSGMTTLLFSAIMGLTSCIGLVVKARRDEKLFKAFLPSFNTVSLAGSQKTGTYNS